MSEINYENIISGLAAIEEYPNREKLVRLCKSFEVTQPNSTFF